MDVFPTAYFGNIAYFQHIVAVQAPVIELKEHFVKQTVRSRCEILGPNGVQTLSIPVVKVNGNKTTMEDIEIAQDNWQKIHWKSMETAYASSPYFDFYEQEIQELIHTPTNKLVELNEKITQRILTWLDIPIKITHSTSFLSTESYTNDFRTTNFNVNELLNLQNYTQVFRGKEKCEKNLSILDLIMNEGPMARNWIIPH